MPTEQTKRDYENLAKNFYKKRLGTEPPSPKRICDALAGCAEQYRPAYWRRLRNALEFDQRQKGYGKAADRIASTRNPMTTIAGGGGIIDPTLRGETAPKQKRVKSIHSDDRLTLWKAAIALNDNHETFSAIFLADQLGVRPVEMLDLDVDQAGGLVHVTGAKQSDDGVRGADRVLSLPDEPGMRQNIAVAVRVIQRAEREKPGAMHRIQSRLYRLSRKLWPRRQARPSLYTFRHQMGGNLKGIGLDRRAVAYIMGHQSTQSVEVYGDRRKGTGTIGIKITGQEAQAFQGRENHREPHAPNEQKAKPTKAPAEQKENTVAPELPSFRGASGPSF